MSSQAAETSLGGLIMAVCCRFESCRAHQISR